MHTPCSSLLLMPKSAIASRNKPDRIETVDINVHHGTVMFLKLTLENFTQSASIFFEIY